MCDCRCTHSFVRSVLKLEPWFFAWEPSTHMWTSCVYLCLFYQIFILPNIYFTKYLFQQTVYFTKFYSTCFNIIPTDSFTWSPSFPTIASNSASKSCIGPTHCILYNNTIFCFYSPSEAYPLYGILDVRGGELQSRGEYKAQAIKF